MGWLVVLVSCRGKEEAARLAARPEAQQRGMTGGGRRRQTVQVAQTAAWTTEKRELERGLWELTHLAGVTPLSDDEQGEALETGGRVQ